MHLNELNPEQRQAASTIYGPVLILAGAGSGKTRTITYRIGHMLKDHKIPAEQILAVSFTNKASMEMKERVTKLVGSRLKRGMTLCTFHSLALRILREDIERIGYHANFTIYDTGDQLSIVREGLKHFTADKKAFDVKTLLSMIGNLKNKGIEPEQYQHLDSFDEENDYHLACEFVYPFYQQKLNFYNAVDFDDILFLAVKLLRQNPDLQEKYSKKYQYIMIDEYQDTNGLQLELIKYLTSTHDNICVVGDDDQAIYAFRGANIENILNFEKMFKKTKVIKLEQNYRSTTKILDLANEVIARNTKRKEKRMFSDQEDGPLPEIWRCGNADHEAQIICDEIAKLQTKGHSLKEMAILYRSNKQVPPIEDQLRLSQIPYTILGGQKFYEKKEIKDLIGYLSIIHNSRDELSLRRIINIPHRGVGHQTLKHLLELKTKTKSLFDVVCEQVENPTIKLNKHQMEELTNFVRLIRHYQQAFNHSPLHTVIQKLVDEINYHQFIEKSYDSSKLIARKRDDVVNFIFSAERFHEKYKAQATLQSYVEGLLLADSTDRNQNKEESGHEIQLMTFHSSKGLEFDTVFVVGTEEELLPHKKSIEDGEVSEERRLCYVALTRARKNLYLSHCQERRIYGKDIPRHLSRFLKDVPDHLINLKDRNSFSHMSAEEEQEYKQNFFGSLLNMLD